MSRSKDSFKTTLADDAWTTVVASLDSDSKTAKRSVAYRKFCGLRFHNRDSASCTVSMRVWDGTTGLVFVDSADVPIQHTVLLTEQDDGFELDNDEMVQIKLAGVPTTPPVVIARKADF